MNDIEHNVNEEHPSPDELKKILHEYISEEEIKTLKNLEQKAIEAEQKVKEYVLSKVEPSEEKTDEEKDDATNDTKLPYYVDIVISLDVKKSDKRNTIPYTIAQDSRKYEIDFISEDYRLITENLYEELQEIIVKRCKKIPAQE